MLVAYELTSADIQADIQSQLEILIILLLVENIISVVKLITDFKLLQHAPRNACVLQRYQDVCW